MKKVLIITSIFPILSIDKKKNENDILLEIQRQLKKSKSEVEYEFLVLIPYIPYLLSFFKSRWRSYYQIRKAGGFDYQGTFIPTFPIVFLPRKILELRCLKWSYRLYKPLLSQLIKHKNIDLVHGQNLVVDGYLCRKIKQDFGLPTVVSLRQTYGTFIDFKRDNLISADALHAISPLQVTYNKEFSDKVELIPHGVKNVFQRNHQVSKSETKGLHLIAVSRMLHWKNLDILIEIIAKLNDINVKLSICGNGPEEDKLRFMVRNLQLEDQICFLGHINETELINQFNKHDAFIMLSYPESLGRVYFEAMACGLPIIGTKNTGIDGIVTNNIEGFLVNHKNDKEIIAAIEGLKDDSTRELMTKNALKLIEKYRWPVICENLESMYDKAINRVGKPIQKLN